MIQGYEPSVISGLSTSIRNHHIHYILMEFWPKGMDLIATSNNNQQSSTTIIQNDDNNEGETRCKCWAIT